MSATERKTIKVTVYEGSSWIGTAVDSSVSLSEFIKKLNSIMKEIPTEFAPTARITITSGWVQNDGRFAEIGYKRPETDEEFSDRMQDEKNAAVRLKSIQDEREKQMYALLKKKFEGGIE